MFKYINIPIYIYTHIYGDLCKTLDKNVKYKAYFSLMYDNRLWKRNKNCVCQQESKKNCCEYKTLCAFDVCVRGGEYQAQRM